MTRHRPRPHDDTPAQSRGDVRLIFGLLLLVPLTLLAALGPTAANLPF